MEEKNTSRNEQTQGAKGDAVLREPVNQALSSATEHIARVVQTSGADIGQNLNEYLRLKRTLSNAIQQTQVTFPILAQHVDKTLQADRTLTRSIEKYYNTTSPMLRSINASLRLDRDLTAHVAKAVQKATDSQMITPFAKAFRTSLLSSKALEPLKGRSFYRSLTAIAAATNDLNKTTWLGTALASKHYEPIRNLLASSSKSALPVETSVLSELSKNLVVNVLTRGAPFKPYLTSGQEKHIGKKFADLSKAYVNLALPHQSDVPSSVANLPEVELFTATDLLENLTVDQSPIADEDRIRAREEVKAQTQNRLEELLYELNPDLIGMWRGAEQSFASKNPDRARHISASLRELFTHVLHLLSPDDLVRTWTSDPSHFDDKRRPTRKARLLFISRNISNGEFKRFVQKDVDTVVEFISLFQRGTHQISVGFRDDQLMLLMTKMEAVLRMMLETARIK